ncbi:MAG: hypothetical protein MUE69_11355 [Myxococcota bacterium]|nr:hypothetical protein [Myxococcota bacterium]
MVVDVDVIVDVDVDVDGDVIVDVDVDVIVDVHVVVDIAIRDGPRVVDPDPTDVPVRRPSTRSRHA